MNKSIDFFDRQFRQAPAEVLDFGSGMGNLAFAAAARGCRVVALDGRAAAVEHMQRRAALEGLSVAATQADLSDYPILHSYDTVVCIGLLMFFDGPTAWTVLADLQRSVRPGGCLVLNVLVEGTTYMDMFDPQRHCLFTPAALQQRFDGWRIHSCELSNFDAPGQTVKRFCTLIAHKPSSIDQT